MKRYAAGYVAQRVKVARRRAASGKATKAGGDGPGLGAIGAILIILGLAAMLGAFLFPVSVETGPAEMGGVSLSSSVANIDLIGIRALISQAGGFGFVGGTVLTAGSKLRSAILQV